MPFRPSAKNMTKNRISWLFLGFACAANAAVGAGIVFQPALASFQSMQIPGLGQMYLLKNATVYSPAPLGQRDILIGGTSILEIVEPLPTVAVQSLRTVLPTLSVLDLTGNVVVPGFIDAHVHATGGGGELGPISRTPEAKVSELVNAGITTAIGILGTDGVSRSLKNLLFKVRALNEDITALMFTGNYRLPIGTLTGSILDDLALIKEVIGVGELAVSDQRSSSPTLDELCRTISDSRVGGLISGKSGLVQVHVGSGKRGLQPLLDVLEKCDIPIAQILPTHVSSRGDLVLNQTMMWLEQGGFADMTADRPDTEGKKGSTFKAVSSLFKTKSSWLSQITLSTDAYGSFPKFDGDGNVISYNVGSPMGMIATVRRLIQLASLPIEEAVKLVTANPAKILGLKSKGQILVGMDADLLVLNASNWELQKVFARGRMVKDGNDVIKGMFE